MKTGVAGVDPVKITQQLRARALAIKPEDIGLCAADCPSPWGMVMELGYHEVVLSLVALADGSVSVYISNGDGVIGCGLHPHVHTAAQRWLHLARGVAAGSAVVDEYPMPAPGRAKFYFLTATGVRTTQAMLTQLEDGAIELAELYYAGYGLIEMIELLGAGVDIADEMRLARHKELQVSGAATAAKSRGRACRILPYAGNAVRRSHN